ncbi:MAG: response regulator [Proteobacteria bacterium]|nr:response regulator [Pseudomonadota bacterium]
MLRFLTCLGVDHDLRLVTLAGVVCLTAALTAFRFYRSARRHAGRLGLSWVLFSGLTTGCGIWATHFIAMLAYKPTVSMGFDTAGTALSLGLAVTVTGIGFGLAVRFRGLPGIVAGGAFLGCGIAVMHYTGMAAFRTAGTLTWSLGYVAVSVAVAVLMATAALAAAGSARSLRQQALGAGLFTLAICGMHFTGMTAVEILPDPSVTVPNAVMDRGAMVIAVSSLAGLIALAAAGAGAIDAFALSASLNRLKDAVNAIPQAVAIFDSDDRCLMWNARYAELNGECAHRLAVGVPFSELLEAGLQAGHYPEARGDEAAWLAQRLEQRRQGCTTEQANAGDRWMRIEDRRMADGGTVSVCTDLTDLKRNAMALARARDEAELANRAKSEFLANMSHEIRTPLNGVVGVADVLAKSKLDPAQAEMVEMIRASGRSLERLLSDVLDLSRIESGRLEIRPEPFHLAEAARQTAALYDPLAQEKGVTLALDIGAETEAWVMGDVVRFKQVVGNLVSNAVKFTEAGEVRLSLHADGVSACGWRCEVADSGIGFDPATKERLFGRFQQADGSVTRRFGGTGLGLAICRQLAELMGGELECESTPGEGSSFSFVVEMPLAAAPEATVAEPASQADGRALTVLLADDHPTNRKVVELILAQAGVELTAVENGLQALEAFQAGSYDAVLMDMQMPVMDGLTATRAIRDWEAERGQKRTPVVMLTANALPEHVEAGRAAGAERHLTKPIAAPALLGALSEIAESAEARRAAA